MLKLIRYGSYRVGGTCMDGAIQAFGQYDHGLISWHTIKNHATSTRQIERL